MPRTARPSNRGPAAAAGNRRAILAAARKLLAAQGYDVALSAIAREAGVGQAVLYRHFPRRLELAYAVFEDNLRELEDLAAGDSGTSRFHHIWNRLVALTVESTAFVEMVVAARDDVPETVGVERLERLLGEPLAAAQSADLVDPGWTTADVVLILNMVYGAAASAREGEEAVAVERALQLIDPRLARVRDGES